jgi:hypothetical protein
MNFSELFHFHHIFVSGGGHLSEMTTQKSEKKVVIWAKEKQPIFEYELFEYSCVANVSIFMLYIYIAS